MEIFAGLATVLGSPVLLGWIALAALTGMIVGAIPGLTASAAIAMLLPLTFHMEPLAALAFLYVIGKSGRYGGSIAAILFNTPGTAASAATQIDGHPLARRGMAGKAMKVATISSVIGDYTGDVLLICFVGLIAWVAIRLGPPELFGVYVAAFVVIGSVIGESPMRGLASAAIGVLLATVGFDPITGTPRMTFGLYDLTGGVGLVPLMIGVFVLGEVLTQVVRPADPPRVASSEGARDTLTWAEYKPCMPHVARSSLIGAFIGMLPGLGSAIAAFVAYGEGKRRAKNPEEWGHGALEGIAAPESANNAVSGPSMAPLLTLGIPGSTIGAILVGVFLIHGIQIGPTLFLTNRDLVYALFAAGLVGIAMYGLMGYFGAAAVGRIIARIPARGLYPVVFLIGIAAAYSARGSLFDVWIAIGAGALGWAMRRWGLNPAAFVIAFVLTGGAEQALRQSLLLSDAGAFIFLERPVALGFLILGAAVLVLRLRRTRRAASVENPA
jgi:putative tricarboxylic transport membrane protein